MIYIDSSVALAYLLAETRVPPAVFWHSELVSSRLLAYEVWTRVNAAPQTASLGDRARALLVGIELLDLSELILARALEPWPAPLRTLDSLHLATAVYASRNAAEPVELASYDHRLVAGARAIGIPIAAL